MKKITFFLTSATIMAITSSVNADKYEYKPYAGIDYTYNQTTAKSFSPRYSVGGLHIGSYYSPYFATELFANQSASDKNRPHNEKIKTSYYAYGLDLVAALPMGCEKHFALLATTGIGEYVVKQKVYPQKHHNEHGYGYRFGGGFRYAFTNRWQTRFITRYVNFDHLSGYDHDVEYNLSLEYSF